MKIAQLFGLAMLLTACSGGDDKDTTDSGTFDSATDTTDTLTDTPPTVTDTDTQTTDTTDTTDTTVTTTTPGTDICVVPACGGDLEGTWEATDECGGYYGSPGYSSSTTTSITWATPQGLDYDSCPVLLDINYGYNFSLTFDGANGLVTASTYSTMGAFELDPICMANTDLTCDQIADFYNNQYSSYSSYSGSSYNYFYSYSPIDLECLDNVAGGCDCDFESGYSYGYNLTYNSDGVSSFVIDGYQYEYCVIGDEMYFGDGGINNRQGMIRVP